MNLTIDKLREKLKNLTAPANEKLKEIKEGADDFLNENVNVPLAERGYPKLGAGLAAAGSSAVDFAVPDSVEEGAMQLAAGPLGKVAGKVGKLGRLGMAAEAPIARAAVATEKAVAKELPKAEGIINKLSYPGSAGMADRVVAKKDLAAKIEAASAKQDWKLVKELNKQYDKLNNPQASKE